MLYLFFVLFSCLLLLSLTRGKERVLVVAAILAHSIVALITWYFLVPIGGTYVTTKDFHSDDLEYYQMGRQFLNEGTLQMGAEAVGINVNQGFSYLIGLLFLVFGDVWFIPNGVSFIAGALLPVLVLRLARSLGVGEREAQTAGWLTVLLPSTSFFCVVGYKDALTLCVVVALFNVLIKWSRSPSKGGFVAAVCLCAVLASLRVGMLPLVLFSYAASTLHLRAVLRTVFPIALLLMVSAPLLHWLEATQDFDNLILEAILSSSSSEGGMANTVLSGGIYMWPLRAPLFLFLPYPSFDGIKDAWELYTWFNLGWYMMLCCAILGGMRLKKAASQSGHRLMYLPVIWAAATLLSLMVRGMPNPRYVFMMSPAVAIMASYSLVSRKSLPLSLAIVGAAPVVMFGAYYVLREIL